MDKYLGEKIDGRYEILEVIGVGGMAVVYKARCHKLNRLVALKILKDDYAQDADFKRRFHAEAQAVAMLSHPNIVAVYDVARSGSVEYIVMELIDGITLKQYMQKKGHLSWRESLHFSTQIAKALSHAHNRGIIHRDIKPHNIMILRDGSVKVADFGIARFASKQNTLTQEALGSVHYISPEQARGSHIDARSDIYSVGVVMYEMLTSRLPYEGDSPVSVAIQHINSIPLTPREVNPDIPEALETITMKSMSASLSKRYASAEALLHDLEEFRKNPSISFDYDIAELMSRDEDDEPTRNFKNSAAAVVTADGRGLRSHHESEDDEVYRARQRNKSITMVTGLVCVLIFIAGMAYLVITFLSSFGNNSAAGSTEDTTVVPNLFSLNYYDVIQDKETYKDVNIEMSGEGEYHDFVPEGCIIKQSPDSKKVVKIGTTVTVTLSRGPRTFPMPNLSNMEYRTAQNLLVSKDYNLKYSPEPIYEISETFVKDYVIRTDPAFGDDVKEGQVVTLYVSKGPKIEYVKMPNLIGKTREEAEDMLDHLDLNCVITNVDSPKPAGDVVWQSEDPDKEVETKTEIQIQVSLGTFASPSPEVTPSPSPPPEVTPSPSPSPEVTPSPSPDITTSTPDVTSEPVSPSPPPEETTITVPVTITLPTAPGTTSVRITKNTVTVVMDEPNNAVGQCTYDITGSPNDSLDIYFGEKLQFTRLLGQQ